MEGSRASEAVLCDAAAAGAAPRGPSGGAAPAASPLLAATPRGPLACEGEESDDFEYEEVQVVRCARRGGWSEAGGMMGLVLISALRAPRTRCGTAPHAAAQRHARQRGGGGQHQRGP